jgi:altronate hydrolase
MVEDARVIRLHEKDNVVTALCDLAPGVTVSVDKTDVVTREMIPFGYKVAFRSIPRGAHVVKYGVAIGVALRPILVGEVVHTHNLRSLAENRNHGTSTGEE